MKNSIALAQRTKLSKDPIDDIFSLLPSIEQKRKAAGLTPIINLCVGEPHLPVNTTIIERMQRYLSQTSITHDFNYNNLQGTEACRKSIQLLYQQYYPHVHYTLDELMISNGATQGIWNAFNCLLDPGDEVIAFEPYYSIYHTQAQLLDAKLLKIPTAHHQFRPDMSALRTILASRPSIKLLCLNFPNNPTGVSLSMDEVSQLCETLNHYPQLAILIDDVNRELTDTPYSILDVDPALKSRSIVINSASKGLIGAPSLRAGMVASNAEWIKEMTVIQAANVTSVSRLTEQILMEGIDLVVNNDIAYQQWIQQSRNEYKQNVLFMRDALTKLGFTVINGECGLFIFADCQFLQKHLQTGFDIAYFMLNSAGVAVIPGEAFGVTTPHIRFSCAKPLAVLQEAVTRIAAALSQLQLKDVS